MASTRALMKLVSTVGQISSGALEALSQDNGSRPSGLEIVPRLMRLMSETLCAQSQPDEQCIGQIQAYLAALIRRYGTCRRAIDALANRSRKHPLISLEKARAWSQSLSVTTGAVVPILKRHGTLYVLLNKWLTDAGLNVEEYLDEYQQWLDGPIEGEGEEGASADMGTIREIPPAIAPAVEEVRPAPQREIAVELGPGETDDIRYIKDAFLANKHPGQDPAQHRPSSRQAEAVARMEKEKDAYARCVAAIVKQDFVVADSILPHLEGRVDAAELATLKGDRYFMESRFDDALLHYREAKRLKDDLRHRLNLAVTLPRVQRGIVDDNFKEAQDLLIHTLEGLRDGSTEWGRVQTILGSIWAHSPSGAREDNLQQARTCYESALTVLDPEHRPHWWAETHMHLGTVLVELSSGDRAEQINEAVEHFNKAMEVWTKERHPQRWASVHNSLGHAWERYPKGNRPANIERAIMCYSAACEVCTQENNPALWARLQNNLGNAWIQLPVGDHRQNVERAIACHTAALEVWSELRRRTDWAATQNNLGNAWALLPVKGEERERNLRRAISCYKSALDVRTRSTSPAEWAATLNNMGTALLHLRVAPSGSTIREAIDCFTKALEVRLRDEAPMDWARTQANLGLAWSKNPSGDRQENLHEASAYYECALEVLTAAQHPHHHQHVKARLDEVKRELVAIERNR